MTTPDLKAATGPDVLNPLAHLKRLGGFGPYGGDQPSGAGDLIYASGMALRSEDGILYATIRAWGTGNHLDYELPITWDGNTIMRASGAMKFRRNLGPMPGLGSLWGGGLFYDPDTQRYFSNRTGEYDTDPTIGYTSTMGKLSPTGQLYYLANFSFSIGDKRTQTVCKVPQWFADAYLGGGPWYAVCGGGAKSGNLQYCSLLPSVCVFQLPDTTGKAHIQCVELQGSEHARYRAAQNRQATGSMRWQELPDSDPPTKGGWPAQPYLTGGPGYWNNGHSAWAGMTWIDAAGVSGPVFYMAEPSQSASQATTDKPGCEWYGHNDGSAAPCPGWSGNKATINSSARAPVLYVTDWKDLAAVAQGQRESKSVQSIRYDWTFPGIMIPMRGLPAQDREGKGVSVAYDPVHGVWFYGLMISGGQLTNGTFNNWPIIHLYQVLGKQKTLFVVTATRTETHQQQATTEVEAYSAEEAIDIAKGQALAFTTTETQTTEPQYSAVPKE
jgi:hypothetical protein